MRKSGLTREEQWVLLGQVRKELRNMESQLNTIVGKWNLEESLLPTSLMPNPEKRAELEAQIKEFKGYIKELHGLYNYSTPQLRGTTAKEKISSERKQFIKTFVASTKDSMAELSGVRGDPDSLKAVATGLQMTYEGLTSGEQNLFFQSMLQMNSADRKNFLVGLTILQQNDLIEATPFGICMVNLGTTLDPNPTYPSVTDIPEPTENVKKALQAYRRDETGFVLRVGEYSENELKSFVYYSKVDTEVDGSYKSVVLQGSDEKQADYYAAASHVSVVRDREFQENLKKT